MRAVVSSTYHDNYFFLLPVITWCWNKLGIDVICFLPTPFAAEASKWNFVMNAMEQKELNFHVNFFEAPEHKQATYAQCLRNYAACLDFDDNDVLCVSDVDMALFKIPAYIDNGEFSIVGYDLVPAGQYPECYIIGEAGLWREAFDLHGKTYQKAIDDLLADDECQDYRACRWSVDQEQGYLKISPTNPNLVARSNGQNQFAQNRIDRTDTYWRDRLNHDVIDAHLWRPGYEGGAFENILELLTFFYPDENFDWLRTYRTDYMKLL